MDNALDEIVGKKWVISVLGDKDFVKFFDSSVGGHVGDWDDLCVDGVWTGENGGVICRGL